MPFEVVFGFGVAVTSIGFVAVIGLVVHRAVRSARDPAYRARIEAQTSASMGGRSATGLSYAPASDPGNPASPMFPGDPGGPF